MEKPIEKLLRESSIQEGDVLTFPQQDYQTLANNISMSITNQPEPKPPLFRMWIGGAWVNDEKTRNRHLWLQFQFFGKTIQQKLLTWKQTKV